MNKNYTMVDKPPSIGQYRCITCKKILPFYNRKDIDFNYCPYCGLPFKNILEKRK